MDLGKMITRQMGIKGLSTKDIAEEIGLRYIDIKGLEGGDYIVLKGLAKSNIKRLSHILEIDEFSFLIAKGEIPESIKEELKTAFMADGNTRGVLKLLRDYNSVNGIVSDEEELRRTGGKIYQSPKAEYS